MIRAVAAWAAMLTAVSGLALLAVHWTNAHAAENVALCSTTMDPAAPIICKEGPVLVTTTIVYPPAKRGRRR